MGRRRFDHLVLELSLALGRHVPRYALWLHLHDQGIDPERLTRRAALAFCEAPLERFLSERGWTLRGRALRRLRRAVERYDPTLPTPYERAAQY